MSTRLSWAFRLLAGLAPLAGAWSPPQSGGSPDPLEQLARWTEQFRRARANASDEDMAALEQLVAEARMLALAHPTRRLGVALALLDLAASAELPLPPESPSARLQTQAFGALRTLLRAEPGGEVASWIAADVLSLRDRQPLERRIAAAQALQGLYLPATRLALFAAAVDPERALREAAMLALEGWTDDGVHRFLLEQLRRNAQATGWISPRVVRRHFASVHIAADDPAGTALTRLLRAALESEDWRAGCRAVQLSPALPDELAMPVLIDGLRTWGARRLLGAGRLRLEGDVLGELRRRSGRTIGLHPERWASWWKARQAAGGAAPGPDPTQTASPGFFGLRPLTDRVVFVLDRSGSMESSSSASGRTRYEEAIEQLVRLLAGLGEATRFGIVLFSGEPLAWTQELEPATPQNLKAARAWMKAHGPRGETQLRPGIAEAMHLDGAGRVDLERLEADTVIVLCDGATAEGPSWVRPLLEGPNEEACLVFHCVQIGEGGDGTLEALAEGSAGEFVRVEP